MNNVMFNRDSAELKTSIYGITSTNEQKQISVSDTGAIAIESATPLDVAISGTPTVIIDNTAPVTITGTVASTITGTPTVIIDDTTPVTITGTTSITGTPTVIIDNTNPVTITGSTSITGTPTVIIDDTTPVTITGTVASTITGTPTVIIDDTTPVTITGSTSITGTPTVIIDNTNPVTVTGNATVTISNTSLTVNSSFVTNSSAATAITSTVGTAVLADQDISTIKLGTFFVYNATGGSPVSVSLQIRPAATATYIADTTAGTITIAANEGKVIPVSTFAYQAQLLCSVENGTSTITAYFNAQK